MRKHEKKGSMTGTKHATAVVFRDGRESLPDVPAGRGRVLMVGINPSPVSVAAGHYYQGRLGKRIWNRLARIGLLSNAAAGTEDAAFAQAGHGLTDVVKRPTRNASNLSGEELEAGVQELGEKVKAWRPGLILFSFVKAARAVLGSTIGPGRGPDFKGVPTFVLSSPYTRSSEAERIDHELADFLGTDVNVRGEIQPKRSTFEEPRGRSERGRVVMAGTDNARSQRVTANDRERGQIRFPQEAKRFFPATKREVEVVFRGVRVRGTYDPRTGPDRPRSAVLRLGKGSLRSVGEESILEVSLRSDGVETRLAEVGSCYS